MGPNPRMSAFRESDLPAITMKLIDDEALYD